MGGPSTRDRILAAADDLFYRHGYEHTSFADIARAVKISRGNFYYHFKSKDEILDAVVALRLDETRTMLDGWAAQASDPAERIRQFIHILIANRAKIMLYGCPVGSLNTELVKLDHPARAQAAGLFTLFRAWLRRQFALLGHEAEADRLAMHLLARSQGVATLASTFRDRDFIEAEVAGMHAWLDGCTKPARAGAP